jgi:hypothetical protein
MQNAIVYQMTGIDLQTQGHKSTAEALAEAHALSNAKDKESAPNPALNAVELAALTDDDLKRMARESLVLMIHGNKGNLSALGAIRELLDRLEGKPVQRQAIMAQIDDKRSRFMEGIEKLSAKQLESLLDMVEG